MDLPARDREGRGVLELHVIVTVRSGDQLSIPGNRDSPRVRVRDTRRVGHGAVQTGDDTHDDGSTGLRDVTELSRRQ